MRLVPRTLERLFPERSDSRLMAPSAGPSSSLPSQHLDSWEALLVGARLRRARRRQMSPAAGEDTVLVRAYVLPDDEAARRRTW